MAQQVPIVDCWWWPRQLVSLRRDLPRVVVVVVLVAALPSASNVALLSERFGADTGRIAMIILVTTAAAFLTFSGAVAFFKM